MATNFEDLAARVDRLEHLFEERAMERAPATDELDRVADRFWARMPFSVWLKISGPTFAVMALGFTALWDAQQATTDRILAMEQATANRILEMQESTADRIMQLQQSTTDRILDLQQQMLDLHREGGAERS